MYFGKTNSRDNTINTNTTFHVWYSDTAMFTVGAWNRNLSLKFQPCVGTDSDGVRQYTTDGKRMIFTSITPENAVIFLDEIENRLLPAIKNKQALNVAIPVNTGEQRKVIILGYDGTTSYIEVVFAFNEDGSCSPENVLRHNFNKRSVLLNYDWKQNKYEELEEEPELALFIDKIRAVKDLTPAIAHSIRHDKAIKEAYSKRYSNNQGNNNVNNYMQQPTSAPINNYNGDMADFLPFE